MAAVARRFAMSVEIRRKEKRKAKPTQETWDGGRTYEDSPTSVYIVDANEKVIIGIIDKETGHLIVDSVNAFAEAEMRDV